jgi:hypothetical protein
MQMRLKNQFVSQSKFQKKSGRRFVDVVQVSLHAAQFAVNLKAKKKNIAQEMTIHGG